VEVFFVSVAIAEIGDKRQITTVALHIVRIVAALLFLALGLAPIFMPCAP